MGTTSRCKLFKHPAHISLACILSPDAGTRRLPQLQRQGNTPGEKRAIKQGTRVPERHSPGHLDHSPYDYYVREKWACTSFKSLNFVKETWPWLWRNSSLPPQNLCCNYTGPFTMSTYSMSFCILVPSFVHVSLWNSLPHFLHQVSPTHSSRPSSSVISSVQPLMRSLHPPRIW